MSKWFLGRSSPSSFLVDIFRIFNMTSFLLTLERLISRSIVFVFWYSNISVITSRTSVTLVVRLWFLNHFDQLMKNEHISLIPLNFLFLWIIWYFFWKNLFKSFCSLSVRSFMCLKFHACIWSLKFYAYSFTFYMHSGNSF